MAAYLRFAKSEDWVQHSAGVMGYLRQDERVDAGIWSVTPAEAPSLVETTLPVDRTVLVLAGSIQYDIVDGPTYLLFAGDSCSFTKGAAIRLRVLEPLRQFFVDHR